MKIENLKEGQVIKNYKELCKVLEIEPKNGGESKKSQLKDIERYIKYEKQGQKFIIIKIYDNPKEKIDKRVNNKGGNNTVFADDIEKLILNMLSKSKDDTVTIARGQLYKALSMCNNSSKSKDCCYSFQ